MFSMLRLDFQDDGESWADCLERWQRDAFHAVIGLPGNKAKAKRFIEVCGPVGSAKDQLIGAAVLAVLRFGAEGSFVLVYSVDKDKTKECLKVAEDFAWREPRLRDEIEFLRGGKMRNASRNIEVVFESTDGPSASGVRYDLAILNEVQEWDGQHGARVYEHVLARAGKKDGRFVCFTNAPYTGIGEWRRDRWESARRKGSEWHYVGVEVKHCPWLKEQAAKAKRMMHPAQWNRLYGMQPSSGRQDLVDEVAVTRAEVPGMILAPDANRAGRRFIGLDIGLKHDHAALVMLCNTGDGAVWLEVLDVWLPPVGGEIDLDEIEARITFLAKRHHAEVWPDPYQAAQMLQHLRAAGVRVEEVHAQGGTAKKMCHAVINVFREGRMRMPPDAGLVDIGDGHKTSLRQQLLSAGVKQTAAGLRIDVERTKAGHFDQLMAFSMAALGVHENGNLSPLAWVGGGNTETASMAHEAFKPPARRPVAGDRLRQKVGAGRATHIGSDFDWRTR